MELLPMTGLTRQGTNTPPIPFIFLRGGLKIMFEMGGIAMIFVPTPRVAFR